MDREDIMSPPVMGWSTSGNLEKISAVEPRPQKPATRPSRIAKEEGCTVDWDRNYLAWIYEEDLNAMGRVPYRKKISEGAKFNTNVERTNQAPLTFQKTPSISRLKSLQFRIGLEKMLTLASLPKRRRRMRTCRSGKNSFELTEICGGRAWECPVCFIA